MTGCSPTQCDSRWLCYRTIHEEGALDFSPLITPADEGSVCPLFVCAYKIFEQEVCCD